MNSLKEVDWSKAPEGTTHYNAECPHPWLKDSPISYFDGGWVEYPVKACYDAMEKINNAVKRPQEWDGSGVPPVGTVCEYRLNEYDVWFKCKIIYVLSGSDHCFVAWCDHLDSDQFLTFTSDRYKLQLRKIKTPEQIAAEERLDAIEEMYMIIRESEFKTLAALYDAGYRKVDLK